MKLLYVKSGQNAKRYKKLLGVFVVCLGVMILGFGLFGLHNREAATSNPLASPPAANRVVISDVSEPDETEVSIEEPYEVPADKPRLITIPRIKEAGFIQEVGRTSENRVAVPTNIHFAGWYTESVLPGNPGLSLIDGHAGGRYTNGVFYDLHLLRAGDRFSIEFGDRSVKEFEVVSVNSYSLDEINSFFYERDSSIERQLNLITCGGRYDTEQERYEERVLLVSKAIN